MTNNLLQAEKLLVNQVQQGHTPLKQAFPQLEKELVSADSHHGGLELKKFETLLSENWDKFLKELQRWNALLLGYGY